MPRSHTVSPALVAAVLLAGAAAPSAGAATPIPAEASTDTARYEHVVVYVHAVASTVSVELDGLPIRSTDQVFGVWNYQFNLSSWLDTEPQTVEVVARLGNPQGAYCTVEVRASSAGGADAAQILARKTLHGNEVENWARANPVVSLRLARPAGTVRPLWADHRQVDLRAVTRNRTADLVREVFGAARSCDLDTLMSLVEPALANQALMEGARPELVEYATRALLRRDCIPRIAVAKTRRAFRDASYEDVMAPLDFRKLLYKFLQDPSRSDGRGNLYTPKDPILIKTRDNREFLVQPFFSYTDETRERRFISRFVFERRK